MDSFQVLFVVAAVVACGSLLLLALSTRRTGHKTPASRQQAMEMECTICHKPLVFGSSELVALTPTEIALVVRLHPTLVGRKLFEYVCPYCDASHCFVAERQKYQWVGVNSYNPQAVTSNCMECGRALARPPWPKGLYDERLHEVTHMRDEYGLICSRCGARCCVGCCKKSTPRAELPYLCPRCHRRPIEKFLHF